MDKQEFDNIIQKLKDNGWVPFLWHVDDVKNNYDVDNEQAIEVLNDALDNSHIIETVFEIIHDICEQYEYERIDE